MIHSPPATQPKGRPRHPAPQPLWPLALLLGLLIAASVLLLPPRGAEAGGVVGDGTPGSCDAAARSARLIGGGAVRFNCGPNSVIITVTSTAQIAANTSIDGGGLVAISGGGMTGVFNVSDGVSLSLLDIIIRDGNAAGGGGILNQGFLQVDRVNFLNNMADAGGAIYNLNGTLTISNSAFISNRARLGGAIRHLNGSVAIRGTTFSGNAVFNDGDGGAILNRVGALSVAHSVFTGNQGGTVSGGGIENNDIALVSDSTFTGNTAGAYGGGGLYNGLGGRLTVTNSTFAANSAGASGGGGLLIETGALTVTNSTFAGNTAGVGGSGGLYSTAAPSIVNSTFAGNSAGVGGSGNISGTLSLKNTIVAGGSPRNCAGAITSQGHNLVSGTSCGFSAAGDLSIMNPLLGPLRDNGGPTPTQALLAGSPAIDHGDNAGCPTADQRGVPRPRGAACDIGAYEYGGILYIPRVDR
jgi:hypothetical protein